MSVVRDLTNIVRAGVRATRTTVHAVRATAAGVIRVARWTRRTVGRVRARGGVSDLGLMRLLDLHAVSAIGDTLVVVGLAGVILFGRPASQARLLIAGYLLALVVALGVLAPLVGRL